MVDQIREALDRLNSLLRLPYQLDYVSLASIKPPEKNARYMPKRQFDQLVANIRRDKALSSVPLCVRDGEQCVCLSGNQRVAAAREAGLERILVLCIPEQLSQEQQVAIQLSHNALVGQDNPQILSELWDQLVSADWKQYSGLDDTALATLVGKSIQLLQPPPLDVEYMLFVFSPPEAEYVDRVLRLLAKKGRRRYLQMYAEWEPFLNALLDFKQSAGVINTSTAFLELARIAEQWVREHSQEQDENSDLGR